MKPFFIIIGLLLFAGCNPSEDFGKKEGLPESFYAFENYNPDTLNEKLVRTKTVELSIIIEDKESPSFLKVRAIQLLGLRGGVDGALILKEIALERRIERTYIPYIMNTLAVNYKERAKPALDEIRERNSFLPASVYKTALKYTVKP